MKLEWGDNDLSCTLLRNKYMGENGFFQSSIALSSQFWKGLHAVKQWFSVGSAYNLHNGKSIQFWRDVWLGQVPLNVRFPRLFCCNEQQQALMCEVLLEDGPCLSFKRSFGEAESEEWQELLQVLSSVRLVAGRDEARWELTPKKIFSTSSMYRAMMNSGIVDLRMIDLWKSHIPLKQKIFAWMCVKGRIQVTDELLHKGWQGEEGCQLCELCGLPETAQHLTFTCPIAFYCGSFIRDCLGWGRTPTSCAKKFELVMPQEGRVANHKFWSLFAAVAWALWLTRNDMVFNQKVCRSALQVVFKAVALLGQWKSLLPDKRKVATVAVIDKLMEEAIKEAQGVG